MSKKPIPKEGVEKLKKEKQLSLKEQMQKDILSYNMNIIKATAQINQWVGAKLQAEQVIERLDKDAN